MMELNSMANINQPMQPCSLSQLSLNQHFSYSLAIDPTPTQPTPKGRPAVPSHPATFNTPTRRAAKSWSSANEEVGYDPYRSATLSSGMSGKITQIIMPDEDEYNFQLLMPLLAQLSRDDRWFAWIAPPLKLPKQWLLEAGIDINKIMMLQPKTEQDTLELAQKALRTGTCHAVISWPGQVSKEQLNQLELAAKSGQSHAIVIQPR